MIIIAILVSLYVVHVVARSICLDQAMDHQAEYFDEVLAEGLSKEYRVALNGFLNSIEDDL